VNKMMESGLQVSYYEINGLHGKNIKEMKK